MWGVGVEDVGFYAYGDSKSHHRLAQTSLQTGDKDLDYPLGDLRLQIDAFAEHDNQRRYHQSLKNLTPADISFGCGHTNLQKRQRTKGKTIETRAYFTANSPHSHINQLSRILC